MIHDNGKVEDKQDTPKEDFILCSNCEKRFEIIETYFSRIIIDIHNYLALPNKFSHIVNAQREIIECNDINPILFRLFIYSLIWRASESNLDVFNKFELPQAIEEELRHYLDSCLNITQLGLLNAVETKEIITDYHICLIKPKIKTIPPGGVLSAFSTNGRKSHILMLVDFALFFVLDDETLEPAMQGLSNKNKAKVIIGLGDNLLWTEMNRLFVNPQ
jgi:hypothetical protein